MTINVSTVLVTGGAGFIGSNFVRFLRSERPDWRIVNYDALKYAGNLANLAGQVRVSVQAELLEGFDKSKLQNGVLEPLREADSIE